MNCRDVKKLLIPFLEADITEDRKSVIETHLHKCESCQKEKALLEKTWSLLDRSQTPEVSLNFTRNLMARLHEQNEMKHKYEFIFPKINIQFGFRVLAPAMASICILIAVYIFGTHYLAREKQVDKDRISGQISVMQAENNIPAESVANVAEVAPIAQKEDIKTETSEVIPDQKVKISAADAEIIRNLDAYENTELYKNYTVINDLDVVENMSAKAM